MLFDKYSYLLQLSFLCYVLEGVDSTVSAFDVRHQPKQIRAKLLQKEHHHEGDRIFYCFSSRRYQLITVTH